MGYCADSVDSDFTIAAADVPAALAAVRAVFVDAEGETLGDVVGELTCFSDCQEDQSDGFSLGWHADKFLSETEDVMSALARFAVEGSYVRFLGEDCSLFGFRVVDGRLRTESGSYVWSLDPVASASASAPDV